MNNVVIAVLHILNTGCTSYILINEVYTVVTEEVLNRGLTQGYKVCLIFEWLPIWPSCGNVCFAGVNMAEDEIDPQKLL